MYRKNIGAIAILGAITALVFVAYAVAVQASGGPGPTQMTAEEYFRSLDISHYLPRW